MSTTPQAAMYCGAYTAVEAHRVTTVRVLAGTQTTAKQAAWVPYSTAEFLAVYVREVDEGPELKMT